MLNADRVAVYDVLAKWRLFPFFASDLARKLEASEGRTQGIIDELLYEGIIYIWNARDPQMYKVVSDASLEIGEAQPDG